MQSYPTDSTMINLTARHRKMLFDESGVDPAIASERGYRTVRSRTELLDYKKYQRRAPALRLPLYSPDGETASSQLRSDNPRKDKKGEALKYETPGGSKAILDVHPRMSLAIKDGDQDLWITEGIKKADCLTSRNLPTIGLIGVWNWQRDGKMLPCWDHVRLDGRRVYVVYDSDLMVKEGVQLALERLVAALEERGAEVLVVYLPGPEKGVDDWLVAGHTVAELKMLARKFEPADFGRIRLSRNEKLRALVKDLERLWWAEEWKGRGGHSERDVALQLIEAAARCGKIHADGLRVRVSWGKLQVEAKVARQTLAKALVRLEERGFLYRDNKGREADKRGAFVLRAKVDQYGERNATREKVTQELQEYDPGGLPLRALPEVPRLRWSRPKFTPKRGTVADTCKVRESKPPEPRERIERLGKIRGAVVDALVVAGGSCTLAELCEVLHRKRPRDVRRRILPILEEAGLIECAGDVVALAADWSERLEEARDAGGEIEADELAEEARKRKSRAYRERRRSSEAPKSEPSMSGEAAVKRSEEKRAANIAAHEEHQATAGAADLEHRRFVKRFVHDKLRTLGRIRLGLLQEILRDAGGTPGYALPAAKSLGFRVERHPEHGNEEFIYYAEEAA